MVPIVTKPVSVEYLSNNAEFSQLIISYSIKDLGKNLRPSYKHVFAHVKTVLDCFSDINVNVLADKHVFTIIGNHIKERLLKIIVNECLMYAVPETMDEYQKSTLVADTLSFEQTLADFYFIDPAIDNDLSEFVKKYDAYFKQRFSQKVLESVREIMYKDIQDMTTIAEGNSTEDVIRNQFLFPQCKISRSTLVSNDYFFLFVNRLYLSKP